MTCSGNGSSPAYSAATVDAGSRAAVATGPQNPCVRLAWGSLSTSSTRRPSWASVPARWWQVLVLPTPPFWLSMVTTGTDRASLSTGRCTVHRYRRGGAPGIGQSRAMYRASDGQGRGPAPEGRYALRGGVFVELAEEA